MIDTEVWIWICLILIIIKYVFIVPYQDKKLFKMYAARDKISLLATRNLISQDSLEYEFVMKTMQAEIYNCKHDYNFFELLKNILFIPPNEMGEFDSIMKDVENNDYFREAFQVCYKEFIKNINIRLRIFSKIVLLPMQFILQIVVKILQFIEHRKRVLKRIPIMQNVKILQEKVSGTFSKCKDYLGRNPYNI